MRHEVKKHQNFENLMRDEVKKIKSLKSDSQAGLPNAGPMAAEDCLAANIRQNKVPNMRISSILNVCIHPQLGKVIEESSQEWPEKGRRQYHTISRQEFSVSTTFKSVPYFHK